MTGPREEDVELVHELEDERIAEQDELSELQDIDEADRPPRPDN